MLLLEALAAQTGVLLVVGVLVLPGFLLLDVFLYTSVLFFVFVFLCFGSLLPCNPSAARCLFWVEKRPLCSVAYFEIVGPSGSRANTQGQR